MLILTLSSTVPCVLPVPAGMGRQLSSHHGPDQIPGLLLTAPGGHSAVLYIDGPPPSTEYAEHAWRDAGDAETGNILIIFVYFYLSLFTITITRLAPIRKCS